MHKTKSKLALKCLNYNIQHFPVSFSNSDSEKVAVVTRQQKLFWVQIKLEKGGTPFFSYSPLKEEKTTPSHDLMVNIAISRPDMKQL